VFWQAVQEPLHLDGHGAAHMGERGLHGCRCCLYAGQSSYTGAGPRSGGDQPSLWFGTNPGKRWTEALFLAYSPFWIAWALCIVVPLQLYEVLPCAPAQAAPASLVGPTRLPEVRAPMPTPANQPGACGVSCFKRRWLVRLSDRLQVARWLPLHKRALACPASPPDGRARECCQQPSAIDAPSPWPVAAMHRPHWVSRRCVPCAERPAALACGQFGLLNTRGPCVGPPVCHHLTVQSTASGLSWLWLMTGLHRL